MNNDDLRLKRSLMPIELIQSFANLVRQKQPDQLEDWYKRASSCQIKGLSSSAKSLKDEL